MPTTANHQIPTPETTELATIPAHMKAMADKVDSELDRIGLNQMIGVDPGKVLIANSSGVVTPRSITGHATVNDAGVLELTQNAVDTAEIKDLAVTTSKIGNGAVTRSKMGSWFQAYTINTPGSVSSGGVTAAIIDHYLGHTNYIALASPLTSGWMNVSWGKGNLIGQEPQDRLTILARNPTTSTISSPSFSVLILGLA